MRQHIHDISRTLSTGAVLLLLFLWAVGAEHSAHAAGVDSIPRKRSASEVLALRLKAPTTYYRTGSVYTRGGASVLVKGTRTLGAIEVTNTTSNAISATSARSESIAVDRSELPGATALSMRVAGRMIYFDGEVADRFTAVDLTGRTVLTVQSAHEVSLQSLRSGVYILRAERDGVPTVIKVSLR